MSSFLTVFLTLFTSFAQAFVPPLSALVREAFDGRRSQPCFELVFRHRVETKAGEITEIEEQWIGDSQRGVVVFKKRGGKIITGAIYEKRQYLFPGGVKQVSSSALFIKYLLSTSADDFVNALLSERFIRREHLSQFKPGFEPKGDPETWEVKDYYITQEGVSIRRVKTLPAFAFSGSESEDVNQTVFFLKGGGGLRRFEWKKGIEQLAWNFEESKRFQSGGSFPRRLEFEIKGRVVVSSELVIHRPSKVKLLNDLKKLVQTLPSPSGQEEEALNNLLSFR